MDRSRTSKAPGKLLRLHEQNEALATAAAAGHAATSSSASQQPAAENDAQGAHEERDDSERQRGPQPRGAPPSGKLVLLPPLCVSYALSFLNIKDRAEARLACRTLLELCPAPWKLATVLLDECVSWHDSFQCPQCEHRLDLEGGRCELCPEPSFPYHPPIGRGRKAWACSDPRFTKVYAALMLQVRGEPDATGPDAWRGGTQRKLFELMARFALRSVQRLQRQFVVQIQRDLAARAMLTGATGWTCHGPEGPHFYSQLLECFGHLRVGGKKIPSARWQLMWAFAEMNLAAWELFQARSLHWYGYDTADTTELEHGGGSSSHSAGVTEYISGPFGEGTGKGQEAA